MEEGTIETSGVMPVDGNNANAAAAAAGTPPAPAPGDTASQNEPTTPAPSNPTDKVTARSLFGEPKGEEADWTASLPEELRGNSELRKFKDSNEALKAYVNATKLIGRRGLQMPADVNDEAAMNAYFAARRGNIENAEAYSTKYNSEDLRGLDEDTFKTVSEFLFKRGFSDLEHGTTMELIAAIREHEAERWEAQNKANISEAVRTLKDAWGSNYESNVAKVQNFMGKFPKVAATLAQYGLENNADMFMMLLEASKGFSEAKAPQGDEIESTPTELNKRIEKLMSSKAFTDANSAGHSEANAEFIKLMAQKAKLRARGLL